MLSTFAASIDLVLSTTTMSDSSFGLPDSAGRDLVGTAHEHGWQSPTSTTSLRRAALVDDVDAFGEATGTGSVETRGQIPRRVVFTKQGGTGVSRLPAVNGVGPIVQSGRTGAQAQGQTG